ncbi:MAG: hypothetical protein RLZZ301_1835 [Bacteroidota bacterium]|jgi:CRP-like cAMP-binding protein
MEAQEAYQQLFQYIRERIPLSEKDEQHLRSHFKLRFVKRKHYFLKEGDPCVLQGFIVAGTFRVFYSDPKGGEHVLYFGFKDWWVGDIASFHSQEASQLNVQALEDSWILEFSKASIELLFTEIPALERLFRIMAQRTLAVLQKRFFLTVSANAEERYKELITRHPGIEQLVPQHQIASYLGILPESLSRMKKKMLHQ